MNQEDEETQSYTSEQISDICTSKHSLYMDTQIDNGIVTSINYIDVASPHLMQHVHRELLYGERRLCCIRWDISTSLNLNHILDLFRNPDIADVSFYTDTGLILCAYDPKFYPFRKLCYEQVFNQHIFGRTIYYNIENDNIHIARICVTYTLESLVKGG